jgi:hypothetical protein
MNKHLNIRIGVEFYNSLISHPTFAGNYKAISAAYYFLTRIARYNASSDGRPVEFSAVEIRQIFRPYTKGSYRPYLDALVSLGILVIQEGYLPGQFADDQKGHCKEYLVSDKGNDLLLGSHMEYLKKLHTDKRVIRRNQKNISDRKVMKRTYGDFILDNLHEGLINMRYDLDTALALITGSHWPPAAKTSAGSSLQTFKEKDFGTLSYHRGTGRIYHEFVQMKSDLRPTFNYRDLVYRAVIDIRACHPTYFSTYVSSLYLLHYVGDKADIATKVKEVRDQKLQELATSIDQSSVESEHCKWISLFTDPATDPREVIARECGYQTIQECKSAIIETLNGSLRHLPFRSWLEEHFPSLANIWEHSDVAATGSNISREYESPLILNPQLYRMAEEMGLKCIPEHDGVGVFASVEDASLPAKLHQLVLFIRFNSEIRWGVSPVLTIKPLDTPLNRDL